MKSGCTRPTDGCCGRATPSPSTAPAGRCGGASSPRRSTTSARCSNTNCRNSPCWSRGRPLMPERIVVVGASLAGLRAVEEAREAGFAGALTLIGQEKHLPYDRPPLSKEYIDGTETVAEPHFPGIQELVDDLGVDLRLGSGATGVNVAAP